MKRLTNNQKLILAGLITVFFIANTKPVQSEPSYEQQRRDYIKQETTTWGGIFG